MATLTYEDTTGQRRQYRFGRYDIARIGSSAPENDIVLAAASGVAPEHAVILRSERNRAQVVVDLSSDHTRLNDQRVVSLAVLWHGDLLALGTARIEFRDVELVPVRAGDPLVNQKCAVCADPFIPTEEGGDDAIRCPRCDLAQHRSCWLTAEHCPDFTCTYPSRRMILRAFAPHMTFERTLSAESELVETRVEDRVVRVGKCCSGGERRDGVPFQVGNTVAYCPGCQAPYHIQCFFGRDGCRVCGFDIRQLTYDVLRGDVLDSGERV